VSTELPGWRVALEGDVPALVAAGRIDDARAELRRALGADDVLANHDPADDPDVTVLAAEGSTR
jgi:hypothetical protein